MKEVFKAEEIDEWLISAIHRCYEHGHRATETVSSCLCPLTGIYLTKNSDCS